MIVSIRGTNGSGKSTVVRELFSRSRAQPNCIFGMLGVRKPEAYKVLFEDVARPVYVLGPYDTPSACGFDGVTNYAQQPELIRRYAVKGHVVFEGLISGKLWGRVGTLLEELSPEHDILLVYLDTSLEECIRRVVARRHQVGDMRPFNEKNLRAVYEQCRGNLAKVRREKASIPGMHIEELSSGDAAARILELLK